MFLHLNGIVRLNINKNGKIRRRVAVYVIYNKLFTSDLKGKFTVMFTNIWDFLLLIFPQLKSSLICLTSLCCHHAYNCSLMYFRMYYFILSVIIGCAWVKRHNSSINIARCASFDYPPVITRESDQLIMQLFVYKLHVIQAIESETIVNFLFKHELWEHNLSQNVFIYYHYFQ